LKLTSEKASAYPGFSPIVMDHLNRSTEVKIPLGERIRGAATMRAVVCDVISEQYREVGMSMNGRLDKLRDLESSTVTTGHQLQLCGGPAFFHYKIITTIRLARKLEMESGRGVVPIFWLASEDHDFKEVSWVNGESDKFVWSNHLENSKLPVGKFSLEGLEEVVRGWGANGVDFIESEAVMLELQKAKANGEKYVHLFRRWLELWYGDTELLVLDASHPKLKNSAATLFAHEFSGSGIAKAVLETTEELKLRGFKVGTHIRDVNLFFQKGDGERVGIVKNGDGFLAGKTVINSKGEDWGDWCKKNAEFLSPGVLLRPLYQELLLSNSHVVLGPGELGYWKQLEGAFQMREIVMPVLHLRDHVLVLSEELLSKASQVGWSIEKGWWSEEEWVKVWVEGEMPSEMAELEEKLSDLKRLSLEVAVGTDPTLEGTALASGATMDKALGNLLKKIAKAIKRKNESFLTDLSRSAQKIYSKGSPQDRYMNFHILSRDVGGFFELRNLLLASDYSGDKAVCELMHVVSSVNENKVGL
jgi:bacillithiol biosynthesis cysteine-adding enzyme BshC